MAPQTEGRSALLVDWGGVLTTDLFRSFGVFCEAEGLDPQTLRDAFRGDREARELLIALEEGRMQESEFEPRLAFLLGIADAAGLIDRLFAGSGPDLPMIEAVRAARAAGVRTGLISNSWGVERYPHELLAELFDGVVLSGDVGMRKPAPEMYSLGATRAGVEPAACVYVDDLAFNLEPARELGMAVVHHTDAASTIDELEALLGVDLSA